MLPCQELKIFDHTPPLNQYTRQTVRKMKNYPQVVHCEAFTKSSGKNNILNKLKGNWTIFTVARRDETRCTIVKLSCWQYRDATSVPSSALSQWLVGIDAEHGPDGLSPYLFEAELQWSRGSGSLSSGPPTYPGRPGGTRSPLQGHQPVGAQNHHL